MGGTDLRSSTTGLLLVALALSAGCGHGIRDLSAAESDYYAKLSARVQVNNAKLDAALDQLGLIYANAAESEHKNTLSSIAKAKLLDKLSSTWANVPPSAAETQRAVALYYLYDLSEADRAALEAQIAERASSRQRVSAASAQIATLLGGAIDKQKLLLQYVNQPVTARIVGVISSFLVEAKAFQAELAHADDERLKKIATQSAGALDKASKIAEQLEGLLKARGAPGSGAATATAVPSGGANVQRAAKP